MFYSSKAFLFCGSDQDTIFKNGSGGVGVVGVEAEGVHGGWGVGWVIGEW